MNPFGLHSIYSNEIDSFSLHLTKFVQNNTIHGTHATEYFDETSNAMVKTEQNYMSILTKN